MNVKGKDWLSSYECLLFASSSACRLLRTQTGHLFLWRSNLLCQWVETVLWVASRRPSWQAEAGSAPTEPKHSLVSPMRTVGSCAAVRALSRAAKCCSGRLSLSWVLLPTTPCDLSRSCGTVRAEVLGWRSAWRVQVGTVKRVQDLCVWRMFLLPAFSVGRPRTAPLSD